MGATLLPFRVPTFATLPISLFLSFEIPPFLRLLSQHGRQPSLPQGVGLDVLDLKLYYSSHLLRSQFAAFFSYGNHLGDEDLAGFCFYDSWMTFEGRTGKHWDSWEEPRRMGSSMIPACVMEWHGMGGVQAFPAFLFPGLGLI